METRTFQSEGSLLNRRAQISKAEDDENMKRKIMVDPSSYAPTDGGWDARNTVFDTTLVWFGAFSG